MSEPPLSPLQGRALELVETERLRPRAPDAARTSVRARLQASMAAPDGGGAKGASRIGFASRPLGRATSHALAFVAGGIAGAAVYAHVASRSALIAPAPPPAAVERTAPSGPVPPEALPSPDTRAPVPARLPVTTAGREAVASESDLKAERALLDRARAALGRGDNDECLTIVKTHADTYPRGRLVEEREALAIKALVNLGRAAEAHQRAGRFRARYPRSLLLPAVEGALDSIP